jgi:hypothetical protein
VTLRTCLESKLVKASSGKLPSVRQRQIMKSCTLYKRSTLFIYCLYAFSELTDSTSEQEHKMVAINALFAAGFLLVTCTVYSSNLKMKAT